MVRKVGIVHEIIVFISVYFTAQTTALTKINMGWGGWRGLKQFYVINQTAN